MRLTLLIVATSFALIAASCSKDQPQLKSSEAPEPVSPSVPVMQMQASALPSVPAGAKVVVIAERDKVCMVNDQFMGKPQIPVSVEGRTYFGCCKMCKEKLEQEVRLRTGVDPVSGRPVDKANAVIGMRASGDVLYFESASTLEQYNRA